MTLLAILALVTGAAAQSSERQPAKTINSLTFVETFGTPLVHLLADSSERQETGRRMSDAIVITGALTGLLQRTTHSPRPAPYQSDQHAFPSAHASLAFATAASLATREPSATWVAYPLAAADAWARVSLGRHTWTQVLAGAALGAFVGRQCGQGKLRIFGNSDSESDPVLREARWPSPASAVGPASRVRVWGLSF